MSHCFGKMPWGNCHRKLAFGCICRKTACWAAVSFVFLMFDILETLLRSSSNETEKSRGQWQLGNIQLPLWNRKLMKHMNAEKNVNKYLTNIKTMKGHRRLVGHPERNVRITYHNVCVLVCYQVCVLSPGDSLSLVFQHMSFRWSINLLVASVQVMQQPGPFKLSPWPQSSGPHALSETWNKTDINRQIHTETLGRWPWLPGSGARPERTERPELASTCASPREPREPRDPRHLRDLSSERGERGERERGERERRRNEDLERAMEKTEVQARSA